MYRLNIGCHRYTITSRDSEIRDFNSREECIQSWQESRKFYHSIGYIVWFAEIINPDDTREMLEQNPCYYGR